MAPRTLSLVDVLAADPLHPYNTRMLVLIAQSSPSAGPSAAAVFYVTLLFIFLTAIITTVFTKWSRDKCLKFFGGYHVTLERSRGHTSWGRLKVFSSGIELTYDHPYVDPHGRKKTSALLYQQDLDNQLLATFRHHDELTEPMRRQRLAQVHATFNPRFFRRAWRGVRNFVNTLRDAFNAAIGTAVGQYQRMNPTSAVLGSQGSSVTAIGQTLLGKFANAYEPLLEQYIGRPVILEVADPINPNHGVTEYAGYLADYTQQFIAVFNVEHTSLGTAVVTLPDVEEGPALPPLPPPPPPGAPPLALPEAMKTESGLAIRIDGRRFKVTNVSNDPLVVRRLERDGFEPINLGTVIPPNATMDLPARDARGARLTVDRVSRVDVVAPRRVATVRHAGELVERRGLMQDLQLDQLPLIPKLFRSASDTRSDAD